MYQPDPDPVIVVIFGAAGDLTWRKLNPSLFTLFLKKWIPDRFEIIGVDMKEMPVDDFRKHLREGVSEFTPEQFGDQKQWDDYASHVNYIATAFDNPDGFKKVSDRIEELGKKWGERPCVIYYQATPPTLVNLLIKQIEKFEMQKDRDRCRIVLEKPFGTDLDSAKSINRMVLGAFHEKQIYRIDHYLGKETVQNILAFRFSNGLFEPLWDRKYIDNIQISVAEQVGVEHRGAYYDHAGALRDMVQNHLLQALCMIAMEPIVNFSADEIRNKKVDVLHAIRPILPSQIDDSAVRGQYGPGTIDGAPAPGYRQEPGVAPDSNTETYAALKFYIDNWRWQNVPFYLRTGKRMADRTSIVVIQFRDVPHMAFPASTIGSMEPNRLVIQIQPNEGIKMIFQAKEPGPEMCLTPVHMNFSYMQEFRLPPPEAYVTLLYDLIRGDQTLFMRADQVETAWAVIQPVLDTWSEKPAKNFPNYPSGSWGPEAADSLLKRDGNKWFVSQVESPEIEDPANKVEAAPRK